MIKKFSFSRVKYKHFAKCSYKVYLYNNNSKLMKFIGIYNIDKSKAIDRFYINRSTLKRLSGYGLNFNLRLRHSKMFLLGMPLESDKFLYDGYFKTLLVKHVLRSEHGKG